MDGGEGEVEDRGREERERDGRLQGLVHGLSE
jgi:hypothetical protein